MAGNSPRGFAAMDQQKQRAIASKGGQSVPPENRSFSKDHGLAAAAGRKGGENGHGTPGRKGGENGHGTPGRKGGENGHGTSQRRRRQEAGNGTGAAPLMK